MCAITAIIAEKCARVTKKLACENAQNEISTEGKMLKSAAHKICWWITFSLKLIPCWSNWIFFEEEMLYDVKVKAHFA